jgi:HlyD family secretion protein
VHQSSRGLEDKMNDTVAQRTGKRQLFRESVLRRQASPENLDRLLTVTTPVGWLALAGILLLLGLVVAWSILGRLPAIVGGKGILLTSGEVWTVTSPASGKLGQLLVQIGDHVAAGQIVAIIEQPDLTIAVEQARVDRDELLSEQKQLQAFDATARDRHERNWTERDTALRAQIARLEEDAAGYTTLVGSSRTLFSKGFATSKDAIVVQSTLSGVLQQLADARLQLLAIDTERANYDEEEHRKEFDLQTRVNEARDQLDAKTAALAEKSKVVSRYEGSVIERLTEPGRDTQPGDDLFKLEPTNQPLTALVYLPAGPGKRVAAGMTVRMATESYNKEEYGYITGQVVQVSNIPQTEEQLRIDLENKTLVQQMMHDGAPLRAVVALDRDPHTASGLHWSSSQGPDQKISQGTLIQGEVVTEYRRPIALAIPLLKSLLGV